TSNVTRGRPDQMVAEIMPGQGDSLVSSDKRFAGFPTHIIWEKKDQRIVKATPATKLYKVVLGENGGTHASKRDPAEEFLQSPDREKLLKALGEIADQAEAFFQSNPQEIEAVMTADSQHPGNWTITILQTSSIARTFNEPHPNLF